MINFFGGFKIFPMHQLCCVVVDASSGNHEAEEYWKAKLPTVAMPEAIKNNLLLWNGGNLPCFLTFFFSNPLALFF